MTAHDEPAAHPGHDHAAADPFCADALRNLYLYLDRELGPDELSAVEAHLHECSPCFEAYDVEAEFRIVIAAKSRAPLPADVRDRLQSMLEGLATPGAPDNPFG